MGKQILKNDWAPLLDDEFQKPYYLQLREFLKAEYASQTIYPPMEDIFNALHYTQYEDVKVVILGQDPYHGENQAHGLAFSVNDGVKLPPSLRNIYKELESDTGDVRQSGSLKDWAQEGVLLLNTVLSVDKGEANSHRGLGWETFTDDIIKTISEELEHVVFILWGKPAQAKIKLIDTSKHHIITSVHPSPLSAYRGFFGSKPFTETNQYLESKGIRPIDWSEK